MFLSLCIYTYIFLILFVYVSVLFSYRYEYLGINNPHRWRFDLGASHSLVQLLYQFNHTSLIDELSDICRYMGANSLPLSVKTQRDVVMPWCAVALISKLTKIIYWQCARLISSGEQLHYLSLFISWFLILGQCRVAQLVSIYSCLNLGV